MEKNYLTHYFKKTLPNNPSMRSKEIISNLKQIYETHSIPKNLRRHMIWVASVAEMLCDNCKEKVDKESIIASCLIHDLGNFIKMDFDDPNNVALFDKEDAPKIPFFKQKKEEMRKKFGPNAEHANTIIAQELGVTLKVKLLVEHRPFEVKNGKLLSNELEEVIASYADLRVSPQGMASIKERMDEYEHRYKLLNDANHIEFSKKFKPLAIEMENKLFTKMKIKPEDINNESIQKYFEKYKEAI
jgi:HD superfamily phosphodiesterase